MPVPVDDQLLFQDEVFSDDHPRASVVPAFIQSKIDEAGTK